MSRVDPTAPVLSSPEAGAGPAPGVYVHVPFCRHRCDYCAFAAWDDRDHLVEAYLDALDTEVATAVADGLPAAGSVFVGGGTPSRVDPHALGRVLDRLDLGAGAEVTVECNPDDVTPGLVEALVEHRVNRISIGVQSLDPGVLSGLGRRHVPDNVVRAVEVVGSADLASFNLDLIYGGHGETARTWASTLAGVVALDAPHVSAYALTVEPGTPLAGDPARHPDEDLQADAHTMAHEALGAAGLEWYEISNWCRPGHETVHHLCYWDQGDYRGFGCAAHSHQRGRRWWNLRTPERYVRAVSEGDTVEAAHEVLDADTRRIEALQLRLRTGWGVPTGAFADEDRAVLAEGSLVETSPHDPGRLVLTERGRLLANDVAVRLLPVPDVAQRGRPVRLPAAPAPVPGG